MNLFNFSMEPGAILPSKTELKRLRRGQFIRICESGYFAWCRVESVNGNRLTVIADDNTPNLRRGARITVKACNIALVRP